MSQHIFDPISLPNHFKIENSNQIRSVGNRVGLVKIKDFVPHQSNIFYFEISILDIGKSDSNYISVGGCNEKFPNYFYAGSKMNSFGFSSNGRLYQNGTTVNLPSGVSSTWGSKGDVIGCGIMLHKRQVFFTLNGKFLGIGLKKIDVKQNIFPCVSLLGKDLSFSINFDETSFCYDLKGCDIFLNKNQTPEHSISSSAVSKIVLDYLLTKGYGNTYIALKNDILKQQEYLGKKSKSANKKFKKTDKNNKENACDKFSKEFKDVNMSNVEQGLHLQAFIKHHSIYSKDSDVENNYKESKFHSLSGKEESYDFLGSQSQSKLDDHTTVSRSLENSQNTNQIKHNDANVIEENDESDNEEINQFNKSDPICELYSLSFRTSIRSLIRKLDVEKAVDVLESLFARIGVSREEEEENERNNTEDFTSAFSAFSASASKSMSMNMNMNIEVHSLCIMMISRLLSIRFVKLLIDGEYEAAVLFARQHLHPIIKGLEKEHAKLKPDKPDPCSSLKHKKTSKTSHHPTTTLSPPVSPFRLRSSPGPSPGPSPSPSPIQNNSYLSHNTSNQRVNDYNFLSFPVIRKDSVNSTHSSPEDSNKLYSLEDYKNKRARMGSLQDDDRQSISYFPYASISKTNIKNEKAILNYLNRIIGLLAVMPTYQSESSTEKLKSEFTELVDYIADSINDSLLLLPILTGKTLRSDFGLGYHIWPHSSGLEILLSHLNLIKIQERHIFNYGKGPIFKLSSYLYPETKTTKDKNNNNNNKSSQNLWNLTEHIHPKQGCRRIIIWPTSNISDSISSLYPIFL